MTDGASQDLNHTPASLRVRLGMSLTALADRANVSPDTVRKIEEGGQGVTVASLEAVAHALGVTGSWLLAACERERATRAAIEVSA
jgi:transcriptional regulator with XRE-family HTH domain